MLSDTAAENAAAQFNAKTENDIKEFFTELGANIETANTTCNCSRPVNISRNCYQSIQHANGRYV